MMMQLLKYLGASFLCSPLEQAKRRLAKAEAERTDWFLAAAEAREAERYFMERQESHERLIAALRKDVERLAAK